MSVTERRNATRGVARWKNSGPGRRRGVAGCPRRIGRARRRLDRGERPFPCPIINARRNGNDDAILSPDTLQLDDPDAKSVAQRQQTVRQRPFNHKNHGDKLPFALKSDPLRENGLILDGLI